MGKSSTYIGGTPQKITRGNNQGGYLELDGEKFYKISHFNLLEPFFMSIASSSDHWLFLSSNSGLTAGRKNPEYALFPYYTVDKIHDSHETTGSKTILRINAEEKNYLWEPFSDRYAGVYQIERNIYKNIYGDKVIFEEINHDLKLRFKYGWYTSEEFGVVKKASLENFNEQSISIEILDGLQNLIPAGVPMATQSTLSTLVDAYKKNELDPETGLGLYMLSSIIVDRAEPSEALKCNIVWSVGLDQAKHLLSSKQINNFRNGVSLKEEVDIRAKRGAYFLFKEMKLEAHGKETWYTVAEVNQGPSDVASIQNILKNPSNLPGKIEASIDAGSKNLARLVASSDGIQYTGDESMSARHFSNVLFNIMRGGVFHHNYRIQKEDFLHFVEGYDKSLQPTHNSFFGKLDEQFEYGDLLKIAEGYSEPQIIRICHEYLPVTFSRRHGDPSRPWNKFSIEVKAKDGSDVLYYAGNWRDIFQNWEALAYSFPDFTESIIAKFVNASTADGYNPYRITRDGIDWEKVEPDDPWSYIGYWGDHQIIYLQKLLEVSSRHHPEKLGELLAKKIFAYANVPYRIKPYHDLLKDPFDTVVYDDDLEIELNKRIERKGGDGKLIWNKNEEVYLVNLAEKLLVPMLAKFSNFIPEAGIWLNTQRPEWNDANNALVGNGVSMVTLYYMRRFQFFCLELFRQSNQNQIELSEEVAEMLNNISKTLEENIHLLNNGINDKDRKKIVDSLGLAGSAYREKMYSTGFSENTVSFDRKNLIQFLETSIQYIDHTIKANKRPGGLFHAYNLMTVNNHNEISIDYLNEMLEGQVAVLSSGYLSPEESLEVLKALRKSAMFREDQYTYLLYPDRDLPRFLEKNNIPTEAANQSELFSRLLADRNQELVNKDINGVYHFNGNIRNANDVQSVLENLSANGYENLVKNESQHILDVFETMFNHKAFTGRSGTFFGYEGLGSIYWHMVSKLLLAAEEVYVWAQQSNANEKVINQLGECYYDIRAGIGFNKSPEEYGAFPSDPYSHTPGHAGAQQPGMTGQVKEDILARYGELGIFVEEGNIVFKPWLLRKEEFIAEPTQFKYYDLNGVSQEVSLNTGMLAYTYCQIPILYQQSKKHHISIEMADGSTVNIEGLEVSADLSGKVFSRTGEINKMVVSLNPGL